MAEKDFQGNFCDPKNSASYGVSSIMADNECIVGQQGRQDLRRRSAADCREGDQSEIQEVSQTQGKGNGQIRVLKSQSLDTEASSLVFLGPNVKRLETRETISLLAREHNQE